MKVKGMGGAVGGGGGSGLGGGVGGGGGGGTYHDIAWKALTVSAAVSACACCRRSSSTRSRGCTGRLSARFAGVRGCTGSSRFCFTLPEAADRAIVTASALNRMRCRHGRALIIRSPGR